MGGSDVVFDVWTCWVGDGEASNINNNITSIALKSSGTRTQKRNKTNLLIIFKSWGHTGVIISLRGRELFKVEKEL